MGTKCLWLLTGVLLLAGIAGCAQAPGPDNAYPIAASPEPVQPAVLQTSSPVQAPPVLTVLPVESSPLVPTLSPSTSMPGLKESLLQASKETVVSARKDLAQRLGLSIEQVTVISVIGQEYTPDAFYCRTAKGRIAKDAPEQIISGETILLQAQGNRYEYHANDPLVVYCRQLH